MQIAEGHEVRIDRRERTYKAIDWSADFQPKPYVEKVEVTYSIECSCGESEGIYDRYGGSLKEAPDFDHERAQRFITRHTRVANGEKGIYECGCSVAEQPRGKRTAFCSHHYTKKYIPLKPSTYKKPAMSAREVTDHLRASYSPGGRAGNEWAFFDELRVGTGYKWGSKGFNPEQRLDAFAINLWPSKDFLRIAFEVKVTRSDFLGEIKKPEKRATGLMLSNQFYFVTPLGLVSKDEIPEECGLIEIKEDGSRKFTVKAPRRDAPDPPLQFLAAIARRSS